MDDRDGGTPAGGGHPSDLEPSAEAVRALTGRKHRVFGDLTGSWAIGTDEDDDVIGSADPDLWRSRLLAVLLRVVAGLGLLVAIPSVSFAVAEGRYGIIVVDAVAFTTVGLLIWLPSLTHRSRSLGLLAITYGLGVYLFVVIGPVAGMYLMAVPVLTAILLGTRPAVASLIVIAATMVVLPFLAGLDTLLADTSTNNAASWLVVTINFIFVAGVITLSCAALISRLEDSLERSRRLAIAIEQSNNGIAIAELTGEVIYVNAAARGFDLASVTDVREMLAGATPPRPDDIDGSWRGILALRGSRNRFVEATTKTVDDRGVRRIVVVMRDVTAERELEEQVRRTEKLQALGTLVGGTAHDFNNALASVVGLTEMLGEQIDEPNHRELIDQIMLATDRARDVVRNLMAFTRHDRAERQPTQLALVLRGGLSLWRASVPARTGVELDIAPGAETAQVVLDPPEIHHVVSNLVANAAHAMRDHSDGAISIALELVEPQHRSVAGQPATGGPPEMLALTVADCGDGIDPDVLPNVFDPFFTTKGLEGTGLGLASVHGTVTSLGGEISIDSTPGVGTVVSIRLPIASVPDGQTTADHGDDDGIDSHDVVERRLHAVVVDDETGILDLVRRQLERRGVTVAPFEMAIQAADYVAELTHPIDVLVTDLTMPSMTGIDLIRAVRSHRPELPIVVMSGYGQAFSDADRASLGVAVVIDKPFTGEALRQACTRAIASAPTSSTGT